jgi:hypothetical protein
MKIEVIISVIFKTGILIENDMLFTPDRIKPRTSGPTTGIVGQIVVPIKSSLRFRIGIVDPAPIPDAVIKILLMTLPSLE